MLTKIISGGQTGADQGALYAAEDLALDTGGWMPFGYRTDTGPNPELARRFGLLEHTSSQYPPRTQSNVLASDATLIFGDNRSPGCRLTIRLAIKYNRPCCTIPWPRVQLHHEYPKLVAWLERNNITVLNVAGNRERTNPGIFAATRNFLVATLGA